MASEPGALDQVRDALVSILADYTAWLEPGDHASDDMEHYRAKARHYLLNLDPALEPIRRDHVIWCDLCGLSFDAPRNYLPEPWTGSNYQWCPDCKAHQASIRAQLGASAFRKYWAQEEERSGQI